MTEKAVLIIEAENTFPFPMETLESANFTVLTKTPLRQIHPEYSTHQYDMVLYNCTSLNGIQLSWLLPLAQKNPETQFLVLAQQISIHAYRAVAQMANIITLQMPCISAQIESLIKELSQYKATSQPIKYPRFITDEPVRMVVMDTGLLIPTRMLNYSTSGAFLDYKGISLRVGYKLKVNLVNQENPPSKNGLQLNAKVVWVRDNEMRSTEIRGVGVQFTDF